MCMKTCGCCNGGCPKFNGKKRSAPEDELVSEEVELEFRSVFEDELVADIDALTFDH